MLDRPVKRVCAAVAALLIAVPASAQATADSLVSFERPNGALMRAGTLTYALSLAKLDGSILQLGNRVVTVSDTPLGGNPSWLVAESRRGTMIETTDSVSVSRADLSPERWTATNGKAWMGASITRDSAFGVVETYQGRASFTIALPANALLSAGMAERVIEMLPLREGYRSAATLVLVDGPLPKLLPAEIVVERTERIAVGRRSADCWRVALRAGAIEQRLWITRDDARVIRSEQAVGGGVLRSDLIP